MPHVKVPQASGLRSTMAVAPVAGCVSTRKTASHTLSCVAAVKAAGDGRAAKPRTPHGTVPAG
ncbi:hypothetical protein D3C71_2017300 [compost metagenome]